MGRILEWCYDYVIQGNNILWPEWHIYYGCISKSLVQEVSYFFLPIKHLPYLAGTANAM